MTDLFALERELCLLFVKNRKEEVSIDYSISNKSVDIIVRYISKADWNIEDGRKDLNRLWRNFNLSFIGYKTECVILNNRNLNGQFVTEYFFPMKFFNIDNFFSQEFKKYESKY